MKPLQDIETSPTIQHIDLPWPEWLRTFINVCYCYCKALYVLKGTEQNVYYCCCSLFHHSLLLKLVIIWQGTFNCTMYAFACHTLTAFCWLNLHFYISRVQNMQNLYLVVWASLSKWWVNDLNTSSLSNLSPHSLQEKAYKNIFPQNVKLLLHNLKCFTFKCN